MFQNILAVLRCIKSSGTQSTREHSDNSYEDISILNRPPSSKCSKISFSIKIQILIQFTNDNIIEPRPIWLQNIQMRFYYQIYRFTDWIVVAILKEGSTLNMAKSLSVFYDITTNGLIAYKDVGKLLSTMLEPINLKNINTLPDIRMLKFCGGRFPIYSPFQFDNCY